MKKIFTAIAAIIIVVSLLTITVSAVDIPKPKDNFFVNDFADVISAKDEQKMQAQGEALYKKCGAQVVVATVKTLDGSDIESYSLEMARKWKIGSDENDDGILLLLAVEERKVRIEVGYGLEGALPDSKTGRILDTYGIEHFKKDDFSTGLTAVYNSLVNEVCIEKGIEPDENYKGVSEDNTTVSDNIVMLIILSFIVFCFIIPLFGKRRRGVFFFPPHGGGFGGGGGGFSGGSGGGFSGGGGSFGGGGSSRGF
ncbi:MAG: TPM domain-containing protein [Acutalibacteraceae bacterium]